MSAGALQPLGTLLVFISSLLQSLLRLCLQLLHLTKRRPGLQNSCVACQALPQQIKALRQGLNLWYQDNAVQLQSIWQQGVVQLLRHRAGQGFDELLRELRSRLVLRTQQT